MVLPPLSASGKVKNLNVSYLNESDVSVEWGYPTEPNGLLLGYGLLVYQDQVCERSIWSPQSRKGYFKEVSNVHKSVYCPVLIAQCSQFGDYLLIHCFICSQNKKDKQ